MYGVKKGLPILIGVFLITAFFALNSAICAGHGWGHGGFCGDPLLGLLQELDLSDAQKKSVADILVPDVIAAKTLETDVQAVATAKAKLFSDILMGESFSSAAISTDLTNLGNAESTLANLLMPIWSDIRGHLTSPQITALTDIVNNIGKHHGRCGHHHMFGFLHKLELTKEQKSEIADIFSLNKANLKTATTHLATARAKVLQDVLLGSTTLTTDLDALGSAQSAVAEVQVTIWTAIRADLAGSSQLTALDDIATKIGEGTFITAAIQKRFPALEAWVAKHQ